MMQLKDIQSLFIKTILDKNKYCDSEFKSLFDENDISIEDRMSIYRGHFIASLTSILKDTYPATTKIVGDKFMNTISREYIYLNPPNSGCLNLYGSSFPEFISKFEATKSLPYLTDIAELENIINSVYYAKDDKALHPQNISEDCNLSLISAACLFSSKFPVDSIRDFVMAGDENNPQHLDISSGSVSLLICRKGIETKIYRLEDSEYNMLKLIDNCNNIENALISILDEFPDFDFTKFIQKFISIGCFKDTSY